MKTVAIAAVLTCGAVTAYAGMQEIAQEKTFPENRIMATPAMQAAFPDAFADPIF